MWRCLIIRSIYKIENYVLYDDIQRRKHAWGFFSSIQSSDLVRWSRVFQLLVIVHARSYFLRTVYFHFFLIFPLYIMYRYLNLVMHQRSYDVTVSFHNGHVLFSVTYILSFVIYNKVYHKNDN